VRRARRLSAEGATVVVADIDLQRTEAAAGKLDGPASRSGSTPSVQTPSKTWWTPPWSVADG